MVGDEGECGVPPLSELPGSSDGEPYFYSGRAKVCADKCGFIDKRGKEVIPLRYDEASSFSEDEGIALVELNGKEGYIDKNGVEYFEE